MSRYALILFTAAVLAATGAAVAGEIYKWTDENGTVHYVDRPTGDPSEERVAVLSSRTDSGSVKASVEARRERVAARDEAKAQRAENEKVAAQEKADQEKREADCKMYRARLENFLQSPRLYREDDSGERVYLDDEQILAARSKVQDQIQKTCN